MYKIKIINVENNDYILLDDLTHIDFRPNDYFDEDPHIYLGFNGIDFFRHTLECETCKSFYDSFGTDTTKWHIEYLGKIKRLDLTLFGVEYNKNRFITMYSSEFTGTIMKLAIDTDTKEILEEKLKIKLEDEDYLACDKILKKINKI